MTKEETLRLQVLSNTIKIEIDNMKAPLMTLLATWLNLESHLFNLKKETDSWHSKPSA